MAIKTNIDAPEGRADLTITRTFDLEVELLYKAYSEAEFITQWMGTKVLQLEHKALGWYQFETSYNNTVVFAAQGCIHSVEPNKRIVRTFEMANANIGAQLEVISFEALSPERSLLTIHTIYQSEAHRAQQLKLPFAQGLNMAHDRLETIFKTK